MMRKIVFASVARLEFEEAVAWYEQQRAGLGGYFEAEIQATLLRIQSDPEQFQRAGPTFHKARVHRFPHAIYYYVEPTHIGIVSVFHGKRDPKKLKQRLN
jgi:toxin ParE1/3/4